MNYQRFLDNKQEEFLLNLSKKHNVKLSFSWEQDKKALKDALQKFANSMTANASEIDMIFLTGELNQFAQLVNAIQSCVDNHGVKFVEHKRKWDKILSEI
jgi:hypothetical protein